MADNTTTEKVEEAKTETTVQTPIKEEKTVVTEDRTAEQFKKLTESNKRLLEANRILNENLAKQKQATHVETPKEQPLDDFINVDPVSGEQYVQTDKLKKVIEQTNERATRAEAAVQEYVKQQQEFERQRQALEQQRQEKEAFESIPEVNPSSERFDRELSKRTEALLLHSYMHPEDYGGYPLSFKQAAESARGQSPAQAKATEKEVKQAAQEAPSVKEQVTAEATGTSSSNRPQPGEADEMDKLRHQSLYGRGDTQTWAIAQRLSKTSHTGTPSSEG